MTSMFKLSAAPAMLAALSLTATPAAAADLPVPTVPSDVEVAPAWDTAEEASEYHRRYRYRRHRSRVDAGDVLAGVLIIGGIAAIASAASKDRDNRYRDRDYRYRDSDYRYRPRRGDYRYNNNRGLDRAVSMCTREIERDARVDTVDNVSRTAGGWLVSGALYNGESFTCSIGEDGRIDRLDYGRRGADTGRDYEAGYVAPEDDRQLDDDRYAAAWANVDTAAAPGAAAPAQTDAQPAYPGGPVENEEPIDGDLEIGTGYQGAGAD